MKLEVSVKKYKKVIHELDELTKKNKKVLEVYGKLLEERDEAEAEIKTEARKGREPGETVTAYEDGEIKVVATAPKRPVSYALDVAKAQWPAAVLERVVVVTESLDAREIEAALMLGQIPEKDLLAARREGPQPTVRISISRV